VVEQENDGWRAVSPLYGKSRSAGERALRYFTSPAGRNNTTRGSIARPTKSQHGRKHQAQRWLRRLSGTWWVVVCVV